MKRALALCGGFLLTSVAALAQMEITFEATGVTVTGVTGGGQVALYGVAHEFTGPRPSIRRWARQVTDETTLGTVTLELGQDVPSHSVWFAVDLTGGETAVSSPRPALVRPTAASGGGVGDGPNGPSSTFRADGSMLDFFVSRCGSGSWVHLAFDGGTGDDDGVRDAGVTFSLAGATAVGKSPSAPTAFASGDRVFSIDPLSFTYSAVVNP